MAGKRLLVIGGGAAGYFAAIRAAERGHQVAILEAAQQPLAKVRISGGGRCNVTHHCFEPRELVKQYPRGAKALRGPFAQFQPSDTVRWFADRGVVLKTEPDGRMFPITDNAQTIVDCLTHSAEQLGVQLHRNVRVTGAKKTSAEFTVSTTTKWFSSDALLLATGGSRAGHEIGRSMGHAIVPPVPSLFTFHIKDARLTGLQGIAAPVRITLKLAGKPLAEHRQAGPLLVTHAGVSGPAVLRLSAFAARELHDLGYRAPLEIDWLPEHTHEAVTTALKQHRQSHAKRQLDLSSPFELPKRLWQSLARDSVGGSVPRWGELKKSHEQALQTALKQSVFRMHGKSKFKEEFVTSGGIALAEVDFRSMQSRLVPGLYFAGEVLDIDGVTGGFNFQNAWTTGWICGNSID